MQQDMNSIHSKDNYSLNVPTCIFYELMPPIPAFIHVIGQLIDEEIITKKSDYAIPYYLEMEMNELGVDSYNSMIDLIKRIPDLPEDKEPNEGCFKWLVTGKYEYPLWNYNGMSPGKISHIKSVAIKYIRYMGRLGYKHPYYTKDL